MTNITTHKCDMCINNIKVNLCSEKESLYYFFCNLCLKTINVCSKQNCNKLFLLGDELKNLKTIYLANSNSKFYKYDDVKNIAVNKYGSINELKKILKEKKEMKKMKKMKMESERIDRENLARDQFGFNKLEFKKHGDCYLYIQYGKPSLQEVISGELIKLRERTKRQLVLATELYRFGIPYDETLKSCYEYVNGIRGESVEEILKSVQNEYYSKVRDSVHYCSLNDNGSDNYKVGGNLRLELKL